MLEEAGVDYKLVSMPLEHSRVGGDEYKRIHPMQKIPTLALPDGGFIFESMAALQYLAEKHRPELRVEPLASDYGDYLQWLHFPEAMLGQYINQFLGHSMILPEEVRHPGMAKWAAGEIIKSMTLFAGQLGERETVLQRGFTIVDMGMGYHCYLIQLMRLMDKMPDNVQAYWKALAARPAWKTASALTL
jgi:glutathione S-transferase